MRSPQASPSQQPRSTPPVDRSTLFKSEVVEIRENRCLRTDPALTGPTEPLPFFEICIPRSGVWIRHVGRRPLVVNVNHVHFLNRGEVHRVEHPYGCGDRNTGLILPRATLVEMLHPLQPGLEKRGDQLFVRACLRIGPKEVALHRGLVAAAADEGADALEVEEAALRLGSWLLRRMHEAAEPTPDAPQHRDLAAAASALLAHHHAEPLSLADVAAALQVSRFHLCRVFARVTGVTLHRYLVQLRASAALEHVLAGSSPLEEIAAATGFANRSALSRHFTRCFGASPSEVRKLSSRRRLRRFLDRLAPTTNG